MNTKVKICKSNYRSNEVDGCGLESFKLVYGLCPSCLYEWGTTTERGKIWYQKQFLPKVSKKIERKKEYERIQQDELEKAIKDNKNKKSLKAAKENTKQLVHKYVRLRDEGKPCVSCGEQWNDKHQAGHCHKAELYETLKYNLYNINNQCVGCNIHKDGNLENYFVNLPKRIGKENFDELMRLAQIDKQFSKVWNLENLAEIRKQVRILIKKLNK